MSAIYMIDGKPHRECDCSFDTSQCPRGNARSLQTAGFNRCLIPADNVLTVTAQNEQCAAPDVEKMAERSDEEYAQMAHASWPDAIKAVSDLLVERAALKGEKR